MARCYLERGANQAACTGRSEWAQYLERCFIERTIGAHFIHGRSKIGSGISECAIKVKQ
jgi:hypothetical protein